MEVRGAAREGSNLLKEETKESGKNSEYVDEKRTLCTIRAGSVAVIAPGGKPLSALRSE